MCAAFNRRQDDRPQAGGHYRVAAQLVRLSEWTLDFFRGSAAVVHHRVGTGFSPR